MVVGLDCHMDGRQSLDNTNNSTLIASMFTEATVVICIVVMIPNNVYWIHTGLTIVPSTFGTIQICGSVTIQSHNQ